MPPADDAVAPLDSYDRRRSCPLPPPFSSSVSQVRITLPLIDPYPSRISKNRSTVSWIGNPPPAPFPLTPGSPC
ncbi:hypothetical protein BU26DRAFT_518706 [Trematosphaeria pertusa]|uniref:Uncharacterized protein n=1 Tax=Trematosphaeria pertusa TaxID=390896 RepID=A0A6A6II52_9PLEO|nr:uncharacterized protein BU26DRAFT_518706 [Trematosphaeria pertusa]KAF2250295.1 hypothetical protein BU26DRAFT_518706 [Trematosphaeria pertusa]